MRKQCPNRSLTCHLETVNFEVMKTYLFALFATATALNAALLPANEILASNEVIATYVGTHSAPCMHMTAECPDRCTHATKYAQFKVIKNIKYVKDGEYGVAKAEAESLMRVDVEKDIEGQNASVAKTIAALKPGDKVELTVTHYYLTKDNSRYPAYPATSLKKL